MAEKLKDVVNTIDPKDYLRLEILSKAQDQQLKSLNKKLTEQKEEIAKLKSELNAAKKEPLTSNLIQVVQNATVEEMICMQEIQKLKMFSDERELTHEEAKKLEIYVKVINSKKPVETKEETIAKTMTDDELLQFMKQVDENK